MKKVVIALMVIAVTAIIGGTVAASKPRYASCETSTQYYKVDDAYLPAGEEGVDYNCMTGTGTCTYYRPDPVGHPDLYLPCHTGEYEPVEKNIQTYP